MQATGTTSDPVQPLFELGWSVAELRGRIATPRQATTAAGRQQTPAERLNAELWRGSQWRIAFDRVSGLHAGLGLTGQASGGRYDPGANIPSYAYPRQDQPDYAASGVIPADTSDVLKDFRLREATRRTLNCLDLLLLDSATMVNPGQVKAAQDALLENLGGAASDTLDSLDTLVERVRRDAMVLIDLWNAYLREQLADAGFSRDQTERLVAYESGHAMATLSWDLTRRALAAAQGAPPTSPPDGQQQQQSAEDASTSTDALQAAWQEAFADRTVSYLQHELAILCGSLDADHAAAVHAVIRSLDVWQRATVWLQDPVARSDCNLGGQPFDDKLRVALVEQASIWQALVLGEQKLSDFTAPGLTNRLYVEAAQLLVRAVGPDQLASLETAALKQAHAMIDPLVEDVTSTIQQISVKVTQPIEKSARDLVREFWPVMVGVPVVLALAFLLCLVLAGGNFLPAAANGLGAMAVLALGALHLTDVNQQQNTSADAIIHNVQTQVSQATTTATANVRAAIGQLPDAVASVTQEAQTAIQRAGATTAQVATAALDDFKAAGERGMQKLEGDLADLENVLAITYPLVDYIVARTSTANDRYASRGGIAYRFLTTVVWDADDRQQELLQVAYAAFGLLGMVAVSTSLGLADDAAHTAASTLDAHTANGAVAGRDLTVVTPAATPTVNGGE